MIYGPPQSLKSLETLKIRVSGTKQVQRVPMSLLTSHARISGHCPRRGRLPEARTRSSLGIVSESTCPKRLTVLAHNFQARPTGGSRPKNQNGKRPRRAPLRGFGRALAADSPLKSVVVCRLDRDRGGGHHQACAAAPCNDVNSFDRDHCCSQRTQESHKAPLTTQASDADKSATTGSVLRRSYKLTSN
jgi:hypothetical protein